MDKNSSMVKLEEALTDDRIENIKKVTKEVKRHFIPYNDLVKTAASTKYPAYNLMWNRDSAYSAIYLNIFINNSRNSDLYDIIKEDLIELDELNSRLINTLWEALDFEVKKIQMGGYDRDISGNRSKIGINHILSRFDVDNEGVKRAPNDVNEAITTRSWTMQYDSAPLILLATEEYLKNHDANKIEKSIDIIKKDLDFIVQYIYNFHKTPCADAWEQYYYYQKENTVNGPLYVGKTIDSYTVSSVYRGIKSSKEIAKMLKIEIKDVDENQVIDFLRSNFVFSDEKRGTFLAKSKIEFGEVMPSIGAEEIEIFSTFIPQDLEEYRKNTLKVIENELFDGEFLPIRYRFFGKYRNILDRYFGRGQWFHLGLQYAMYLKENGNYEEADNIIKYIESKIGADGTIPEQEVITRKLVDDPDKFFEKNGNKTIECLFWAETAYLAAASKLRV
ncbi:MAG: hypothetical protein BJBARM5_0200 [Candidatus Parvarchaeum acidophilus ARMAN-5]|jgi:GH15 family glucan-1,4-alpha-glucosidase|uniref:Glycoside hydrolase 15-related protein n=1 Tax=Candidatus Parvarchaeum acidophilus ARMAN-5 TaxID=662762 RepID=D6GUQ4_PARA5|nr:MAG: hypothetical protein BJBARM5_0200 [Candidatus Parvarchaeum acidophilus ARMAN-5]